jgi:DNA polymerase III subunit delta'
MLYVLAKVLISPNLETRVGEIKKILTTQIPNGNLKHPDIFYLEAGEKMGIAQARAIINHLSTKPYQAKGKAVLIEDASNLTSDAQNALLKTLEEPPEEAILILGVNSENDLLPTILSRCEIVTIKPHSVIPAEEPESRTHGSRIKSGMTDYNNNNIEQLISSTIPERFAYIEKLKEKEEFLKALIIFYRQKLLENPTKENKEFVEELLQAEKWFKSNVNQRAILEYLIQIIPN